ncbi:MAG: hypothetical protein Q7T82_11020 [Armatimonadota bacterium]|nr:hypothetical protein [Armatimonadota bacterium]
MEFRAMIEGIASYELAEIYAGEPPVLVETKNVRTILYPIYTILATGI